MNDLSMPHQQTIWVCEDLEGLANVLYPSPQVPPKPCMQIQIQDDVTLLQHHLLFPAPHTRPDETRSSNDVVFDAVLQRTVIAQIAKHLLLLASHTSCAESKPVVPDALLHLRHTWSTIAIDFLLQTWPSGMAAPQLEAFGINKYCTELTIKPSVYRQRYFELQQGKQNQRLMGLSLCWASLMTYSAVHSHEVNCSKQAPPPWR